MRELKFRAYDVANKKMLFASFYDLANVLDDWTSGEYFEVMQFTGFQDSKGVDIYEGDIINIKNDGYVDVVAQVVFDITAFWLYSEDVFLAYSEDADNMIRISTVYMDTGADGYLAQLEVIGNVHQNPELL